uniref:DUF4806 domain-containing protein n=1 Tax=Anopheles melas TaxID=34690 RepID=A0A1I8JV19_9DIPT
MASYSQHDKDTGKIYRFRDKLESKFNAEFEAEQKLIRLQREQEAKERLANELLMTCEDEDPTVNPDSATIADVMKMLKTVSRKIGQLCGKQDTFQKEVCEAKHRVLKLEAKMNTTLSMTEKVKDEMLARYWTPEQDDPPEPGFEFRAVSNEQEMNDLDHRLATDEAFCRNLTNWLKAKISLQKPFRRMLHALDLVFEREFLMLCSWKGRSKSGPKIAICEQRYIVELFRVVGSNRCTTITDKIVAKFFVRKLTRNTLRPSVRRAAPYNLPSRRRQKNSDPLALDTDFSR